MTQLERMREALSGVPDEGYWRQREQQGWRLAAIEWTRPAEGAGEPSAAGLWKVPYGLRVAEDCQHLEADPREQRALTHLLDLLLDDDLSLAAVAEEMNRQGFRTRTHGGWTQRDVFELLPRLVEASPEILGTEAWGRGGRRVRGG